MSEFADRICACTDASCVEQVAKDMTRWSQEMEASQDADQLSDDETKQASAIAERMSDCMQQAMSGSATP